MFLRRGERPPEDGDRARAEPEDPARPGVLHKTEAGAVRLGLRSADGVRRAAVSALGVLGEYMGRALDGGRRRPPYLIEAVAGSVGNPAVAHE